MNDQQFPKPKVEAVGAIRYKCFECNELMDPKDAVIVDGKSWHVNHAPKRK